MPKTKVSRPISLPRDLRIVLPTLEDNQSMLVEDAVNLLEGIKNPKQQKFLLALAQLGNRTRACQAVGISLARAYEWRHESETFEVAFHKAMEIASDLHEDELIRRGTEGVLEPVFQGGRLVGTVRRYDTTALIFALKGSKPDKYRERVEHSGNVGVDLVARLRAGRDRALAAKGEE